MAEARLMSVRMKVTAVVVFVAVVMVVYWYLCWFFPPTTVLLLRHADRLGNQDQLNQAGIDRAAELVHVAEKAGITAIYHSEAFRTQRTAQDFLLESDPLCRLFECRLQPLHHGCAEGRQVLHRGRGCRSCRSSCWHCHRRHR